MQLARFLSKFSPGIAREARTALARLRRFAPGAYELVYDNYYALVIGFAPNERPSDAVLSLVVYPGWISVCFLQDATELTDPDRLLRGSGNVIRHVRLASAADLDRPPIRALVREALRRAPVRITRSTRGRVIIRLISAKQRPRRASTDQMQPRRH